MHGDAFAREETTTPLSHATSSSCKAPNNVCKVLEWGGTHTLRLLLTHAVKIRTRVCVVQSPEEKKKMSKKKKIVKTVVPLPGVCAFWHPRCETSRHGQRYLWSVNCYLTGVSLCGAVTVKSYTLRGSRAHSCKRETQFDVTGGCRATGRCGSEHFPLRRTQCSMCFVLLCVCVCVCPTSWQLQRLQDGVSGCVCVRACLYYGVESLGAAFMTNVIVMKKSCILTRADADFHIWQNKTDDKLIGRLFLKERQINKIMDS